VNPGLKHGFPNLDGLRSLAKEAEHRPAERHAFKQFNLNIWQAHSRTPLFDMAVYDEGRFEFELSELEDLPCFIGVDLSVNGDLTAVVAAWRHDDGRITVFPWFFVPGDDLRGRADRDGVPYEQWKADGFITAIDGPIIEPEIVEAHIRELCATNNVIEVAFDPHLARTMMQRLHNDGIPAIEMRQGPLTMAPAIGDLERTVNGRKIRH
ncbi:MAG: terminase large subunit, partial [Mesorhizobium sp.]